MRQYNRFTLDKQIECRIGRKYETAALYNLSSGGCMIETPSAKAEINAPILVRLNDKTEMPGHIVWRIGKNAGIKFDLPLHTAVVEALGYEGVEEDFDRNDPRDRFGIPLLG
ncbi:MAG: PilZ domain-containing protein [Sphingomonadales bacterium]|nr:PilZ domain-containing protein [Sphingomonadales bacterium]MBD3772440.1 PilZ domain-containing protein [Paracoccaceae bacterium]